MIEIRRYKEFDYHNRNNELRIHGSKPTLATLKAYFGCLGIESGVERDGGKDKLAIRSRVRPEFVEELLDDWDR